jgi:hypothetical protein
MSFECGTARRSGGANLRAHGRSVCDSILATPALGHGAISARAAAKRASVPDYRQPIDEKEDMAGFFLHDRFKRCPLRFLDAVPLPRMP